LSDDVGGSAGVGEVRIGRWGCAVC
jgi:hypothetical protein